MPYPNEHSARLKDPDSFDPETYRRESGGMIYGSIKVPSTIDIIWAKLKGHSSSVDYPVPQALRFSIRDWTASQARAWLSSHKVHFISFEAATNAKEQGAEDLQLVLMGLKELSCGVKSADSGGELLVEGYCSKYGIFDTDGDIVLPGAFDEFIVLFNKRKETTPQWLPLLYRHRWEMKIGYVKDLVSDVTGLFVKAVILETTDAGRFVADLVRSKEIKGFSYSFVSGLGFRREGVRYLTRLDMTETTLTPFPANRLALVKSFSAHKERYKGWKGLVLDLLKEDGMLTNAQAKTLFTSGHKEMEGDDTVPIMNAILNEFFTRDKNR